MAALPGIMAHTRLVDGNCGKTVGGKDAAAMRVREHASALRSSGGRCPFTAIQSGWQDVKQDQPRDTSRQTRKEGNRAWCHGAPLLFLSTGLSRSDCNERRPRTSRRPPENITGS